MINGLYAAFPYLRSTPSSVVVNLASASAIYGQPELAVYSATKFFIRAITEALDLEWERYGIRVISMWPLFVKTAMTDDMHTGTTDRLGIHLTAGDVAEAIVAAVDGPECERHCARCISRSAWRRRPPAFSHASRPAGANRQFHKRISQLVTGRFGSR